MSVQTKLDEHQRDFLRILRDEQKDTVMVFHYPTVGATLGIQAPKNSAFFRVSVAHCSLTENKYRKKVGEFLVRKRLDSGAFISLPREGALDPSDMAHAFASSFL